MDARTKIDYTTTKLVFNAIGLSSFIVQLIYACKHVKYENENHDLKRLHDKCEEKGNKQRAFQERKKRKGKTKKVFEMFAHLLI